MLLAASAAGIPMSVPALTQKDRRDLAFGLEQGVDYVALSFVREAADVEEVKALIRAGQWLDAAPENRVKASQILSQPEYVGADYKVIANSMTGTWEYAPGDKRPLRLLLDLTSRAGAWQGARSAIARLLETGPDWLWIVDPIDGTTNFVHGMPVSFFSHLHWHWRFE